MQTIIDKNKIVYKKFPIEILFGDNEIAKNVRIVDFVQKTDSGESIITLSSVHFTKGPVRVNIVDNKLILVISEFIDIRHKMWTPVNDWEQFTQHSYTRMHNVRIMLPGDNFYILRQFLIPKRLSLKVVLGRLTGD